jgi:hypothetical protein
MVWFEELKDVHTLLLTHNFDAAKASPQYLLELWYERYGGQVAAAGDLAILRFVHRYVPQWCPVTSIVNAAVHGAHYDIVNWLAKDPHTRPHLPWKTVMTLPDPYLVTDAALTTNLTLPVTLHCMLVKQYRRDRMFTRWLQKCWPPVVTRDKDRRMLAACSTVMANERWRVKKFWIKAVVCETMVPPPPRRSDRLRSKCKEA